MLWEAHGDIPARGTSAEQLPCKKDDFINCVLKTSTLALEIMGTHIPAGLLAADLTSCHVGEVLEIGKYYRIKKKKKSLRVEREESQERKYLRQRITTSVSKPATPYFNI